MGYSQPIGKSPVDKLIYKHIMHYATDSQKKRTGFDSEDCKIYLASKGVKVDISAVEHMLRLMTMTGILDECYSGQRKKVIYRLR